MDMRDLRQNIAIAALSLCAVFLFSQTQFFRLGASAGGGYLQRLTAVPAAQTDQTASLSVPVRCAVTGAYGRYGRVDLTLDDEAFAPVKTLLREVLGSAHSRRSTTQADFLSALEGTGVYCDFLSAVPVEYLSAQMGAETESPLSARALAAAEQGGTVMLLIWDGDAGYYQCASAALPSALEEVLSQFQLGVSSFAFAHTQGLLPLSLFPDPLPQLPQLTAADPPADTDDLLPLLRFNPHTNARYEESGGTQVIVENDRSLRLTADRHLSYSGGAEGGVSVEAAGQIPTVWEAAAGVGALLQRLSPPSDAGLYLTGLTRTGEETHLTFGFHVDGVPIRLPGGTAAAEAVLTGQSLTSLTLLRRTYRRGEAVSLLLPLTQTLAVAPQTGGAELFIGYADRGVYPLSAAWLAE